MCAHVGEFAEGKRHGPGVLRTGSGVTVDGVWYKGRLQKELGREPLLTASK